MNSNSSIELKWGIHDLEYLYDPKTDLVTWDSGSIIKPFDKNWVYGRIHFLKKDDNDFKAIYIGVLSSLTEDILPHKLKYLGMDIKIKSGVIDILKTDDKKAKYN